jgi:hypothetical protein
MRLKHDRLIRPFALAATAAMLAMAVALVWGTGVGLAADYQDANRNVCEGEFTFPQCGWGSHVTGSFNVALGDEMMPLLSSGSENVALNFGALASNTQGSGNIAIGKNALEKNTTGKNSIAIGWEALKSNNTGENLAIGNNSNRFDTTGIRDVAIGDVTLQGNSTGSDNTADGYGALFNNTTGRENTAIGSSALVNIGTGSGNVALGSLAGTGILLGGSNNICISNTCSSADSGTTRIGTEGKQTRAFVAGVYGTAPAGTTCSVVVNTQGQLGCGAAGRPTAIATFASFVGVGSGHCLNYTELAGQGQGNCPPATIGFSKSNLLAGPTPAGGATVSNLFAEAETRVTGTDTVLVAVIDNATGGTLLSCTVDSSTVNYCSNTGGSGSAAARDKIEVKVTATGPSGNNKPWRVTFRY